VHIILWRGQQGQKLLIKRAASDNKYGLRKWERFENCEQHGRRIEISVYISKHTKGWKGKLTLIGQHKTWAMVRGRPFFPGDRLVNDDQWNRKIRYLSSHTVGYSSLATHTHTHRVDEDTKTDREIASLWPAMLAIKHDPNKRGTDLFLWTSCAVSRQ